MPCTCGFSTEYPNCNGTHKVVKAVKDRIIAEIEAIDIDNSHANALGFKMLAIEAVKKVKGV
jgi:CDGSH-type Zn-finger protein